MTNYYKEFQNRENEKTDIYRINSSEFSPNIVNCYLRSPATSVAIERSFSLLGKILLEEKTFEFENIKKKQFFIIIKIY